MDRGVPFFDEDPYKSKLRCFDMIGYSVTSDPRGSGPVHAFHQSQATTKIAVAPARTSKSWATAPEVAHAYFPEWDPSCYHEDRRRGDGKFHAVEEENIIWPVGMTFDTIKEWDYTWRYLVDSKLLSSMGCQFEIARNNPTNGDMHLRVVWPFKTKSGRLVRSVLQAKSAKHAKSWQGDELRMAVVSEAAEHNASDVNQYLTPRSAEILYPTTPKRSALWLYEMIQDGLSDLSLGIENFKFNRFSNPKYDHERYEREKRKSELRWGDWQDDPWFLEQYEGEWTFEGGKVLPFRWIDDGRAPINVVTTLPSWIVDASFYVSTDYGFDQPACALFWAVHPAGMMCIIHEIYQKGLVGHEFADEIESRLERLNLDVEYILSDPQRPDFTKVLRDRGHRLCNLYQPSYLRARDAGYERLRAQLSIDEATMEPGLLVYAGCPHTIAEWKAVRFKEGVVNEFSEGSIIGRDDAIDAARYFLMSQPKPDVQDEDWVAAWQESTRSRLRHQQRLLDRRDFLLGGGNPSAYAEVA